MHDFINQKLNFRIKYCDKVFFNSSSCQNFIDTFNYLIFLKNNSDDERLTNDINDHLLILFFVTEKMFWRNPNRTNLKQFVVDQPFNVYLKEQINERDANFKIVNKVHDNSFIKHLYFKNKNTIDSILQQNQGSVKKV
jgi:hypothetical protein